MPELVDRYGVKTKIKLPSKPHMADDLNYMKEYLCQVTQFLDYTKDAITCPDLTDFDVLLDKIHHIEAYTPFIEKMIGIQRKDPYESRKNNAPSKAPSSPKDVRRHGQSARRGKPRPSETRQRAPSGPGKTRGHR